MKMLPVLFLGIALLVGCVVGCGDPDLDEPTTLKHLVDHLTAAGLEGEVEEKAFGMIGAVDGFGYTRSDFHIELYLYATPEQNVSMMFTHRKGRFAMKIHEPTSGPLRTQIEEAFLSF